MRIFPYLIRAETRKENLPMKNARIIYIPIVVFAFVLLSYGLSFAGGGEAQDPAEICEDDTPEPTEGPVINGSFTVSFVKGVGIIPDRFILHLVLKKKGEEHLYQFKLDTLNKPLCDFAEEEIIENLEKLPCEWGIGQDFGIDGYPVIFSLSIENQDMCGTDDAMIAGSVKIRVVPI